MIDADLVEQALAKRPQAPNFPSFHFRLILFFPPNSGFFHLNSRFFCLNPAKNAQAKNLFNIQHVLKTAPHRYSLIQKYKPVESSTPSRLDPGCLKKKVPTGVRKCRRIGCSG
jgi:hypothetical protein